MIRIVRGLLCHHEPTFDYSNDQFTVKHLAIAQHNLDLLATFQANSAFDSRGEGVVRYRRLIDNEKHSGLWLITFFESTNLLVHHAREAPRLAQAVVVDSTSRNDQAWGP